MGQVSWEVSSYVECNFYAFLAETRKKKKWSTEELVNGLDDIAEGKVTVFLEKLKLNVVF